MADNESGHFCIVRPRGLHLQFNVFDLDRGHESYTHFRLLILVQRIRVCQKGPSTVGSRNLSGD